MMVGVDDDDVVLSLCFCLGMDVREGVLGSFFFLFFLFNPPPEVVLFIHSLGVI